MALHRAKKAYRREVWAACCAFRVPRFSGPVTVHLDFYPPDRRKRDDDNIEAAFKAGRDQIATHIHVDDADWTVTRTLHSEPVEGGQVVVTISEAGE